MFAEACCYFVLSFLSLRRIRMVACLQDSWITVKQKMVSQTDCVPHILFICCRLKLNGTYLILLILFCWFFWISFRKKRFSANILCWEKVTSDISDHVVLPCHLPGKIDEKCVVEGMLLNCELSSQVAFTCEGREGALFYLFIVPPSSFFFLSNGGCVTRFTLIFTIKESLAGGNASYRGCVRLVILFFFLDSPSLVQMKARPKTDHKRPKWGSVRKIKRLIQLWDSRLYNQWFADLMTFFLPHSRR